MEIYVAGFGALVLPMAWLTVVLRALPLSLPSAVSVRAALIGDFPSHRGTGLSRAPSPAENIREKNDTMPRTSVLSAAIVVFATAAPAFAISCKDDIATVERRLNSAGAEKVTGKEPLGGASSSNSPKALDKQPEGEPSDPGTKPTAAGVEEAKKLLEKAKSQDKAGEEQACQDTMTKVKEAAGALP